MTVVLRCSHGEQPHRAEPSDSTARNRLTDGRSLQPLPFASGPR